MWFLSELSEKVLAAQDGLGSMELVSHKNTVFQKVGLIPSPSERVLCDIYSV